MSATSDNNEAKPDGGAGNFVREIIAADQTSKRHGGRVATRFPPEPNGYLHIGHAKAICVDFGLAQEFGGTCNLRFDDTNPTTEDVEYVEAIQEDIRWLGFEWSALFYASDYFEKLYQLAVKLIEKGRAYVDSLSEEQIRDYRGDFYKKGGPAPTATARSRRASTCSRACARASSPKGRTCCARKIDLETQNMNLRDPVLYRIRYAPHHRTGKQWCIYPMYDYAHPLSDAIEEITHSICTLEFESHRPLYDWCIQRGRGLPVAADRVRAPEPDLHGDVQAQARRAGAEEARRRAGTTRACRRWPGCGAAATRPRRSARSASGSASPRPTALIDVGLLEHGLRDDLNRRSPRVMAVLRPLKLVIDNFPEGEVRELEAPLHPEDAAQGTRKLPFSRVVYVDRDDFREDPPKDWFRLAPGREVRLRYACLVTCTRVVKDASGEVTELRATWDPASWGGSAPDGRTVRGTLHWVSAAHAVPAEVRLYDRLFAVENPGTDEAKSFIDEINPTRSCGSTGAVTEPYLASSAKPGTACSSNGSATSVSTLTARPASRSGTGPWG